MRVEGLSKEYYPRYLNQKSNILFRFEIKFRNLMPFTYSF